MITWRNRDEFFEDREATVAFLRRKWERELDYRLQKNLWCFSENRIAVGFEYESRDKEARWWRSHGNELWEFDENGLMKRRDASKRLRDRRDRATHLLAEGKGPSARLFSVRAGARGD